MVTKTDKKGDVLVGDKIVVYEAETDVDEVMFCIDKMRETLIRTEKDYEDGKLKYFEKNYPYFQSVIESFYSFLETLNALNMLDLYKKAESPATASRSSWR